MRQTLNDVSNSRIPGVVGCCKDDLTTLASFINEATQRLINASGETGFWGGWQRTVFNVECADPYITIPREIARIAGADVCRSPININNQWYEFLEAGPGLQIDSECQCGSLAMYDRGTVPTAFAPTNVNKYLRLYVTDSADVGRRVLISDAIDQNGVNIFSQDGLNPVDGFYMTLNQPFVTSTMIVNGFKGIIKDATFGDVLLKEVDATTGEERLLSRYAPDEKNPSYRRYFIKNPPKPVAPATTFQIEAMAKLEFIPLVRGTDFLLIGNIPALKEECASIKHAEIESPQAEQMSIVEHKRAIRLLNQELTHYLGKQRPAITTKVNGLEGLREQRIGAMI